VERGGKQKEEPGLLSSISNFLTDILVTINGFTGNYGISIILLTIGIRGVLLPLTYSQVRSTKKMQELQPEVQELQDKYKDTPEKLNEETMKLWKEHNVNPMAGCLPLVIQLPILWAFFRALTGFEGLADAAFLWIPSIGSPDPYYILPVIAGAATFVQSRLTTPGGAEGTQKTMLYMMPLFIAWISSRYPAGLALYWSVSSVFGAVQQYFIPTSDSEPAASGASGEN
jgi:YidC/Oxa1 family membrane protein insertase